MEAYYETGRRDAPRRRLPLVRDRELLPAGPRVPAQPRLLARARLPGRGGRRGLDDRPRAAPEPARPARATSRLSKPAANRPPTSSCSTPAERGTERLMLGLRLDRPLELNGLAAFVDDDACERLAAAGMLRRCGRQPGADRARPVPRERRGRERPAMSRAAAHAPPGRDPDAGDRLLHLERPSGRVEDARRAGSGRGVAVDGALRARRARGARLPRPSAHVRRAGADRRRLPALRRVAARAAARAGRAPRRPVERPERGRHRAADHHRDAVAGDVARRPRHRAAARDDRDPPHRGAAAPAAGRHGRHHHGDGRGDEADLPVPGRRRPEAGRVGERVPERAADRRPARWADAA